MTISGSLFLVCLLGICHAMVFGLRLIQSNVLKFDHDIKIFGDTTSTLTVSASHLEVPTFTLLIAEWKYSYVSYTCCSFI